jgi:hypothetical protein
VSAPRIRSPWLALACALLACAAGARAACPSRAFVLGSDYSTGTLSVLDLATGAVARDVAVLSGDPVARWHDGWLYVVNRMDANVQVIDPARGYATVLQFSVGNGSNPQDIAFASPGRAYVSRLGDPDLLIVEPTAGAVLGTVRLAGFADADGNPEAAHMAVVGDLLFVALGRLTSFVPADTGLGLVAVVDLRADTLFDADPATPGTQALRLHASNPSTDFARLDPVTPGGETRLYLGCTGRWFESDGGIEEIVVPADAADGGALRATGLLVTESALGGDVTGVVADGAGHPYAVVSDAAANTRLVGWDPASGAPLDTVFAPGGFSINGAALDGCGRLVVCDGAFTSPGLYLFGVPQDTLLAGPVATGLPPVGIVFDDGAAPPPDAGDATLSLGAPWPNPAADRVHVALTLARAASVAIELHDVAGRRVLALPGGEMGPGTVELDCALVDAGGRALRPGVYVVRARAGSSEARRRLVVVR